MKEQVKGNKLKVREAQGSGAHAILPTAGEQTRAGLEEAGGKSLIHYQKNFLLPTLLFTSLQCETSQGCGCDPQLPGSSGYGTGEKGRG